MFSLIRSNQRKSALLIFVLLGLLLAVGWAVGYVFFPPAAPQPPSSAALMDVESAGPVVVQRSFMPPASTIGIGIAVVIWVVLMGTAFAGGEQILLAQAGASEVTKREHPRLLNIVEEMQLAAGLKTMPRVYVINSPVPNAFAVGRTPERACVAVTTGLLSRLNRDELQGVIAHEMAHIANRDTMFMTLAGVTVGAIVMIADVMRHVRFSSYGGKRSKDSGQIELILFVIALILIVLSPILAQMLYFACSRRREYLADACGAQFTRYPEGLASALEKISKRQPNEEKYSRVLAPMYIVGPQAAHGGGAGLFSTHPPAAERIAILRGMGRSASLAAYEAAYKEAHGGRGVFRPGEAAAFAESDAGILVREPSDEFTSSAASLRETKSALHVAAGLEIITCACGLRMKLPPGFDAPAVKCPRCGAVHPR